MDEREAYELFAPARERTHPQPRISMAEVYEADARRRKTHRRLAVGGSLATVLLAMTGTFWATRGGGTSNSAGVPPTPSAAAGPDLVAVLRQVAVPPNASRTAESPSPEATGFTHFIGDYRAQTWTWTTAESPTAAIATVTNHPPTSMRNFTSGHGSRPGETDANVSFQGTATPERSAVQLDVTAVATGDEPTHVSATAWVVMRKPKPLEATVQGTIESLVATVNPVNPPASGAGTVEVPAAEAQKVAALLNAALMATSYDTGPHECGPNPRQTTLTFQTSEGRQVFSLGCGGLTAGTGADAVVLELPAGLTDEVAKAVSALVPTPSPSFAPTPGTGTLDIGILVVGGPTPGINDPTSAGTITVLQDGKRVAGGTVTEGHRLEVHLPAGSYQVQANIGGSCPLVSVKAESGGFRQVEARCDIR